MSNDAPDEKPRFSPDERANELGRRAGRLFRTGAPRLKRAFDANRPKAEQAGRGAMRYAQEHQDEIKAIAIKGARMRLGPLGMALDALGIGGAPSTDNAGEPQSSTTPRCGNCQSENATNAKFCNQCGVRLEPEGSSGDAGTGGSR